MFCHECLKFLCSYLGFQYSGFNEENFTICLESLRDCSELNNGNIQDFFLNTIRSFCTFFKPPEITEIVGASFEMNFEKKPENPLNLLSFI